MTVRRSSHATAETSEESNHGQPGTHRFGLRLGSDGSYNAESITFQDDGSWASSEGFSGRWASIEGMVLLIMTGSTTMYAGHPT